MLQDIRDNIRRLIALYEGERERSEALSAEIGKLKTELDESRKQNTELNRKIDNLRLSGAIFSAPARGSGERLDKLIREVDKCIKLLEG